MCELFALSSRLPASVTFSLEALARHGGGERPSMDGWGVAFYDGPDARVLREPAAASESPWVDFIEANGPLSTLMMSHIRNATAGSVCLANTHPFARPLGGHRHTFAHNGNVKGVFEHPDFSIGRHRPIGQTDSEAAFCALLARLEPIWAAETPPSQKDRYRIVANFAAELKNLGPANFLYSDGDYLFAYGDRRRQADGCFVSPGLHILSRHCSGPPSQGTSADAPIDGISVKSAAQIVQIVASVPLSDEAWRPFEEGELLMLRHGEIIEP